MTQALHPTTPWSAGTKPPSHRIPAQSVDCHMHIFDPQLPKDPTARDYQIEATVADYRLLQTRLGITRNVIVQPSTYGTDNQGLLQALSAFGPHGARGIAVVDERVSDHELHTLDRAGVRGLRFNFVRAGSAVRFEMLSPLAARIATLGWHLQIQAPADLIVQAKDTWGKLPCPIVFDHFGGVVLPSGKPHPAFETLRALLQQGQTWLKLSAPYLMSGAGGAGYPNAGAVARVFIKHAPERLLWASNWPHATEQEKPDDAAMLDAFCEWSASPDVAQQILVDNPTALYGFSIDQPT